MTIVCREIPVRINVKCGDIVFFFFFLMLCHLGTIVAVGNKLNFLNFLNHDKTCLTGLL